MRSYSKRFSNIYFQVLDLNEKLIIQGFRFGIYDKHINLIIGSKGMGSFYGLLKETQYIADSQEARKAFNPNSPQRLKEQDQGSKGKKKGGTFC